MAIQLALLKGERDSSLIRVYGHRQYANPHIRRDVAYPSSKAEEDLRIKSLDLSLLVLYADDPSQNSRILTTKDGSFAKVSSVDAKPVQRSHHLSSPADLQIFQIIQRCQSLREVDLIQIRGKASAYKAGDKARG